MAARSCSTPILVQDSIASTSPPWRVLCHDVKAAHRRTGDRSDAGTQDEVRIVVNEQEEADASAKERKDDIADAVQAPIIGLT